MAKDDNRPWFHWQTSIAWKDRTSIVVRGYDVNELTGNLDFGEMLFLVLRGELPNDVQGQMTNALMVNLAEHAMSPSSATVRFATSGGPELSAAVAAGVAAIGRLHGTADLPAVMFRDVHERVTQEQLSVHEAAAKVVREMRERGERMPGFHHPQHIKDPRSERLLGLADELNVSGTYVEIARAMEAATPEAFNGRTIHLNGPGSVGCIGLDLGFEPIELKALFIVCRSLSLVAHSIEESRREKGWRASSDADMVQPLSLEMQGREWYDGPADRSLPASRMTADAARRGESS